MSTTASQPPRAARVGIIGAGFAGLATAIRLHQEGLDDFLVLERGAELGGTWRDNTYPGCACDVPSNLYSYSFSPNPDWTTTFAHQDEIRRYTERVAAEYDLPRSIHLDTRVQAAAWDGEAKQWNVETNHGAYVFDVLVSATGPLSEPAIPQIPGLAEFDGPVFHSAQWDYDADLAGKRVAVIGTGASAIQFVPELQQTVGRLTVFQRTPPWLLPRSEFGTSRLRRLLFRRLPVLQRIARLGLYWSHELAVVGFTRRPAIMRVPQLLARRHLHRQLPGDPALRAKLTPNFTIGCKRILLSNTYYPALGRPNVEVIAAGVTEVRGQSVIGAGGEVREVDAIVLGTGFHATDLPIAEHLRGTDGRTLAEHWQGTMQAYRGATVPGFPNLFFVLGPNTTLGHSSMIFMAEAAAQYVVDAVGQLQRGNLASVEVRPERHQRWNEGVQKRMRQTVWMTGGCASWYLDEHGRNATIWPDFSFRFRALTARFDIEAYETLPRRGNAGARAAITPAAHRAR